MSGRSGVTPTTASEDTTLDCARVPPKVINRRERRTG
jgi:hypothetical protein